MPWITKVRRLQFIPALNDLIPRLSHKESGDLTYIFYIILDRLFKRERRWNVACILMGSILGALLCFFQKHVWPYEMEKLEENTDV